MAERSVVDAVRFLEQLLIEQGLDISKIIMFGSQAKRSADEESDIDVAIISGDFRDKDIFERAMLTKEAEIITIKQFMVPLDIITLTPEEFENEFSLISEYAKNGEVIYTS